MKQVSYQEQKITFDDIVMKYIANRIFTPISESDACVNGLLDDIGNVISDPTSKNAWTYTNLDRFVLMVKQYIGERKLTETLDVYYYCGEVPALKLLNGMNKKFNKSEVEFIDKIVAKVESVSYLPDGSQVSGNYLDDSDECKILRISRVFTIASMLLYTLKQEKVPNSIEFDANILNSVEITFYMNAFNNFTECKKYLEDCRLIDGGKISDSGIKLLVSIAHDMVDGNLLSDNGTRIEDQSRSWKRLGAMG